MTSMKEELIKWNDKIWLWKWYQTHGLPGPPIIAASYSSNTDDVINAIGDRRNYCVKPSHLSESQGVAVVADGKLVKDVDVSLVTTAVPADIHEMKKNSVFTAEHAAILIRFMHTVTATWDSESGQKVPPGFVIEELLPGSECKVVVGLGKRWMSYGWNNNKTFTHDYNRKEVHSLAEKAARAAGCDIVRVDIVRDSHGVYRISELTWNPRLWGPGILVANMYVPVVRKYMLDNLGA